ncbi:MAG: sugar transporter [Hyphomicrobium sp.]|uniref:GumC family protein n=1 Tax=Hyphomicrobium sp. TaxID=82 RepID=UPI0039E25BDF
MQSYEMSRDGFERSAAGLDLSYYIGVLRKRPLYLILPFLLIVSAGVPFVFMMKPMYLAQGRLLVESQQVPTDLVRPTVTASAKERIQVIIQRVLTRDNLLAISEKFHVFADRKDSLTSTQLLDLMRDRTHIDPYELSQSRDGGITIAVNVGFEYEQPDVATAVANELMTLILNEDAKNRARRAQETSDFLAQEVARLQRSLSDMDLQIAQFKKKHPMDPNSDKTASQLADVRSQLEEKSAIFSATHPDVVSLKKQLAALEKFAAQSTDAQIALDVLNGQRTTIQRNLDSAQEKLTAARLGESLEKAQFSERLEVLEQAVPPQKPFKPNRPKLLGFVIAFAAAAGLGCLVLRQMFDSSVTSTRDLYAIVSPSLVVGVPYIVTKREKAGKRIMIVSWLIFLAIGIVAILLAVNFFWRPLDELWALFLTRLLG